MSFPTESLHDSESNLKRLSVSHKSSVSLSPLPICNVEACALETKATSMGTTWKDVESERLRGKEEQLSFPPYKKHKAHIKIYS